MKLLDLFFPGPKRTRDLSRKIRQLGYVFHEKDTFNTLTFLKDFQLFRKSGSKRVYNQAIIEERPLQTTLHAFDYEYLVSTGKHTEKAVHTVFMAYSKSLAMPDLFMRPEHFGDKIGNLFGSKDIDFPGFPAFSDRYFLRGLNEDYIRDFFLEEVLYHFEIFPGWYLEASNYCFILYRTKKEVSVVDYDHFLSFCLQTYRLFVKVSERLHGKDTFSEDN